MREFYKIYSIESYLIFVNDNTTISTGVKFLIHDNAAIKVFNNGTDLVRKVTIGKNYFIDINTIFLSAVSIVDNSMSRKLCY